MTKVEKFLLISGRGEFLFKNIITNIYKKLKLILIKNNYRNNSGWAHNNKNTGKKDLICILWSNEIYNENKPDTVYLKIN